MNIIYTQTSSKGNCTVIEFKSGDLLVVDAGIKYNEVEKRVRYRAHKATAILVTHAHKDHTKYLDDFIFYGIHALIGEQTFSKCNIDRANCTIIKPYDTYTYDGFVVKPVEMVHTNSDRTDCECYGFLIKDRLSEEKLLWATDTQYIKNKFPPLEYYCIECNFFEHDNYNGEIEYIEKVVEQRRLQSHMSFESCVKFLKMQDLSKCREIYLLHVSSSLREDDKKRMKRKLRSQLRNQISRKGVKIYV